jgi:hypothetical protein
MFHICKYLYIFEVILHEAFFYVETIDFEVVEK